MVWFWWWWTTKLFWYLHSKYSLEYLLHQLLRGVCSQNNKSQPSQKSNWHKGIGLIQCKLARMSYGYFAGPQATTSSTTRYVPSSSAQLSTVVVHRQEETYQLYRSCITRQRSHCTVLFAFGAMNVYGVYIRWEKSGITKYSVRSQALLVYRTTAIKWFAVYCQ